MNRISIILTGVLMGAALSSAPQTVSAQQKNSSDKKPAWITQEPKVKDMYYGIVSVPKHAISIENENGEVVQPAIQTSSIIASQLFFNDKYKETARKDAQKKILSSLHLAVDGNSLLATLIKKGVYTSSFDDVFIDKVFATPMFKLQEEWEDEEEYWCYYTISESDYQKRMTELEDSICGQAQTTWEVGMSYQKEGLLYNAAKSFSDALNLVHPLIYSIHPIKQNFVDVDLYSSIYESYIHVYDNLQMKPSISMIPAVAGESVPVKFTVSVDQNGTPVSKVGIVVNYDGQIDGSQITDEKGTCTFSIVKAAQEQQQTISFSLDKDGLFDLPETYVFTQLTPKAETFGSTEIAVSLFDPTNYIYLSVEPSDSAIDKAVRDIVATRNDLVIVTDKSKADLIMTSAVSTRLAQESVAADKWAISQYESALNIGIVPAAGEEKLFEYAIDKFQFLAPATRTKDQVLHSSAKEMSRQVTREFSEKFKPFSYDKRSITWSKLNQ